MNRIPLLIVALLFFFLPADAQNIPYGMKYQAVARDHSGNVLANQKISLKITLYSQENKQVQYSETHTNVTNALGLFSLTIGEGTPEIGVFNTVPWSTENIWMALAIDETGGNNYIAISDSRLLAVPYAFHAATASRLSGADEGTSSAVSGVEKWKIGGNDFPGLLPPNFEPPRLGTTTIHDLVFITSNTAAMTISGRDGSVHIVNDLDVDGETVSGKLNVEGDVILNTLGGTTAIYEATELKKTLDVGEATTLHSSLDVLNWSPSNLTGTLNVDGTTDLNSSLDVNNGSYTNLTGTLNVEKATTLQNSLDVKNESPSKLTGTLNVDGTTNLNNSLDVNNGSYTNLTGTLNVEKATDLNNSLTVIGITTLNNTTQSTGISSGALQVGGGVGIGKSLNIGESLRVDGKVEFKSTFSVITENTLPKLSFDGTDNHIAHFKNEGDGNGILIQVGAETPHTNNNFITFLNKDDKIVGRIEGEDGVGDYFENEDYRADIAFLVIDAGLALADVGIATADLVQAGIDLAAATTSSTACVGVGACATTPIPSFIAAGGVGLVSAAANLVLATTNLALVVAKEVTYKSLHHKCRGVSFASGAGDYAECLLKLNPNDDFLPGELVGLKNGFISRNTLEADRIMVISFKPAVLGAMPSAEEKHKYEKVAFLGQVPTKVMGAVEPGDYILASGFNNGYGIAKHPEKMLVSDYKKILGVAWEGSKGEVISLINVAVGLNVNDLSGVVQKQQEELSTLKKQIAATNNVLADLIPGFKEATNWNLEASFTSSEKLQNEQGESNALESNIHSHNFLTQYDVKMVQPDESNIIYYIPKKDEYKKWIESAKEVYVKGGGKIEDHPFWDRLSKDPDYIVEVIQELEIRVEEGIQYHVDHNSQ